MKKYSMLCLMAGMICICLTGCVPGDGTNSVTHTAGFFSGVWHGWIAPFSLVYSLANTDIGIYEVHNNGFWYDLGYYAAIISGFGGLTLSRKKSKNKSGADE